MLNQNLWRVVGGVCVALCALMAWYGTENLRLEHSPVYLAVYWGIFFLLLVVTLYIVFLDIRYIRLQYTLGERDVFENTLGSEEFRKALREAQEQERKHPSGEE